MHKFFRCSLFLSILLAAGLPAVSLAASLQPVGLQDASLLPENGAEFRLGFSYADDLYNQFQSQDLDRRIAELPSLTLNLGLGQRVEGQLQYSFLHLDEDGRSARWGSGDLTVAGKVRLNPESISLPALALRVATKLPVADEEHDLGTDRTDFFATLLTSRNFQRFSIHVNLGLAILEDPRPGHSGQDDMLQYGVALGVPLPLQQAMLLVAVEGLDLGPSLNRRGVFRGGVQIPFGPMVWDLGAGVGYVSKSEDWSVRTGLTYKFQIPQAW